MNRLNPGCCCGKCWLFGIGIKQGFEQYTTGDELTAQIAQYSVDPDTIVLSGIRPAIAPGATWQAKGTAGTSGFLIDLTYWTIADGTDFSIIAAPVGTPPEEIDGPESLVMRWTYEAPYLTLSLRSDFDDDAYPIGIGERTVQIYAGSNVPRQLAWYPSHIETSQPILFTNHIEQETGLAVTNLSRPIAANIPRQIYFRNHHPSLPVALSFMGQNITEWHEAALLPDPLPPARCQPRTPYFSGTRHNEPVAIRASTPGGVDAEPLSYSSTAVSSFEDFYTITGAEARTPWTPTVPTPQADVTEALEAGPLLFPVTPQRGLWVRMDEWLPLERTGTAHPLALGRTRVQLELIYRHQMPVPQIFKPNAWTYSLYYSDGRSPWEDSRPTGTNRLTATLRVPPWDRGEMPPLELDDTITAGDFLGDWEVVSVTKPAGFVTPTHVRYWLEAGPFGDELKSEWITEPLPLSVTISQQIDQPTPPV